MGRVPQELPEGLAELAPGPVLAAVLGGVDRAAVSGFDTVTGLLAARRLQNFAEAEFLAWVVEVESRDPSEDDPLARLEAADPWAPDEVRAALSLTRTGSATLSTYAHAVVVRLPALHAAMTAGTLDRERARVFADMTATLSGAHAAAVVDALLPALERGPLSTGQLRDRIAKRAISLDPHWAKRRYEAGLKEMKVYGRANDDGTADLIGQNLPKDRVAAASGRIDAMAKAAKRAGDPRPIDHIRSWLYLGMTDGEYAGMTDPEILAYLAAERLRHATDNTDHHSDDGDDGDGSGDGDTNAPESDDDTDSDTSEHGDTDAPRSDATDNAEDSEGSEGGNADNSEGGDTDDAAATDPTDLDDAHAAPDPGDPSGGDPSEGDPSSDEGTGRGPDGDSPDVVGPDAASGDARTGEQADPALPGAGALEPVQPEPASDDWSTRPRPEPEPGIVWKFPEDLLPPPAPEQPGPEQAAEQAEPERRESPRIGVELQIRLSTALELDEFPGELAGFGPIHAAYARDLLRDLGAAQWRFAICGQDGYLITSGLTPIRPTGLAPRSAQCQAIVELQIPVGLFRVLLERDPAACQDIDPKLLDAWDPVLADIARRIHTANRPGAPPADGTDDPSRRTPKAALTRDVRMRRRRCIGVNCRAPARNLELDHTRNHGHGGPTVLVNLAPACGHDHHLKHEGGWMLRVIDDHTYEWTSRLGRVYLVTTPPVIEALPEPMPDPSPAEPYEPTIFTPTADRDSHGRPWQDSTSFHDRPQPEPPPPPSAPAPPPLPPELDIPPF